MNTTEIKKKLKELKSNTTNVSKELNELENILYPTEEILFASSTLIDGSNWLLTCTNKRIILLDKGLFKGTTKHEINYKDIWQMESKKGILFGNVIIKTIVNGKSFKLDQLIKTDVDRLLTIIEEQKNKDTLETASSNISTINNAPNKRPIVSTLKKSTKRNILAFNVAGVTMENDFGKDIQSILQKEGKKYCQHNGIDLYDGMTAKEIKEDEMDVAEFTDVYFDDTEILFIPEPTNVHDKNAIKVYIKYFENRLPLHIGYVPKDKCLELRKILEKNTYLSIEGNYVGGKIKDPIYNPETGKTEIEIKTLSIGVEIEVTYEMD